MSEAILISTTVRIRLEEINIRPFPTIGGEVPTLHEKSPRKSRGLGDNLLRDGSLYGAIFVFVGVDDEVVHTDKSGANFF